MKKMFFVFSLIACFAAALCGTVTAQEQSKRLEFIIEPGEHWLGKMKYFIFSVNKSPQFAAWIEDSAGNYIATITVTGRSAKENWRGAPKEGRQEALPVWNHARQKNKVLTDIDAATTATPKGSIIANIGNELLTAGNTYKVYLEINHSFDYNTFWTKDNSGVNGQPSLIYCAQFAAGEKANISLTTIGHGSLDGADGDINENLEKFTTALDIIKEAQIVVN